VARLVRRVAAAGVGGRVFIDRAALLDVAAFCDLAAFRDFAVFRDFAAFRDFAVFRDFAFLVRGTIRDFAAIGGRDPDVGAFFFAMPPPEQAAVERGPRFNVER
jgi:hypothetical protein